jgi:hypothetical protein
MGINFEEFKARGMNEKSMYKYEKREPFQHSHEIKG